MIDNINISITRADDFCKAIPTYNTVLRVNETEEQFSLVNLANNLDEVVNRLWNLTNGYKDFSDEELKYDE